MSDPWAPPTELDIRALEARALEARRQVVHGGRPGQGRPPGRPAVGHRPAGRPVLAASCGSGPRSPAGTDRDRFVLSKGHCLDRAVQRAGPVAATSRSRSWPRSTPSARRLQGHPGHDPPARPRHVHGLARAWASRPAVGMAIGARRRALDCRVVRHARRRRVPGGPGLGGGHRRPPAIGSIAWSPSSTVNGLQQFGWTEPGDGVAARRPVVDRAAGRHLGRLRLADDDPRRARHAGDRRRPALRPRRRPATGARRSSWPTRSRAAACRSWRAASSGTPGCPPTTRPPRPWPSCRAASMSAAGGDPAAVAVTAPADEPPLRSQRVVFGETLARHGPRHDPRSSSWTATWPTPPGPTSWPSAPPTSSSRWASPSRTSSAWPPGWPRMGCIPYISTFACFAVARALDQLRVTVAQPHLAVKIARRLQRHPDRLHRQDPPDGRRPGDHAGDAGHDRAGARPTTSRPRRCCARPPTCPARSTCGSPATRSGACSPPARRHRSGRSPSSVAGGDVVLVSTGTQTRPDPDRRRAARRGRASRSGVVHVACLKPLDGAGLLAAIGAARLVVSVEEHTVIGGLGGAVAELLAEPAARPRFGASACPMSTASPAPTTPCSSATACPRSASPSRSAPPSTPPPIATSPTHLVIHHPGQP